MASVFYSSSDMQHVIYQPQVEPQILNPAPPCVQVDVSIILQLRRNSRHYCLTNQSVDLDDGDGHSSCFEETVRFDLDAFKSYDQTYGIIAPLLAKLGLEPDAPLSRAIIDEIIPKGLSIGTEGRHDQVLALDALIWGTCVEHIDCEQEEDEVLIQRAAEEYWELEFESNNYNMAPAEESSIKKMLKSVGVEAVECDKGEENILVAENCVICLEELKIGSDASQMPCSHTFHGDCIEKWLKQSHYCPVCRFEMPTE